MTHPNMEYIPAQPRAPQRQPIPHQAGARKYRGSRAGKYDARRQTADKWIAEQKIIQGWLAELPAGSEVLDLPVGTGRFLDCYQERQLKFHGADLSADMLYTSARKLDEQQAKRWVDAHHAWEVRLIQQDPAGNPMLDKDGNPILTGEVLPIEIDAALPVGTILPVNGRPAELGVSDDKLTAVDVGGKGTLRHSDVRKTWLPDKAVDCAINCRITRWLIEEHGPQGIIDMLREMQRVTRQRIILTARVANHKWAVTEDLIRSALNGWKITRNEAGYVLDYRIIELRPA